MIWVFIRLWSISLCPFVVGTPGDPEQYQDRFMGIIAVVRSMFFMVFGLGLSGNGYFKNQIIDYQ
jgi:hypothetical protein